MLLDLLKAYSPTGREERAVNVLRDYAKSLGFDDVHLDGVGNLVAEVGYGERSIALIGHIDTVPGELPVEFDGSVVKGRGAVDAKGPLVAMFVAAAYAKKLLDLSRYKVYAVAVVGEEGDSRGAKELIRRGFRADGIIIGEPSNGAIVIGYRGSMKLRIECKASRGHTASPPTEASACEKLVNIWLSLRNEYSNFKATATSVSLLSMKCGEDSEIYSIYPDRGLALIDVRIGLDDSREKAEGFINSVVNSYNCTYRVLDYTPPIKVSVNSSVVRALVRALLSEGRRPRFVYKLGTSDMNLLHVCSAGNIAAYGPGNAELSHSDYEEIEVGDVIQAVKIYANTIQEFFKLYDAK
jgi:LysW-gamma-L-lysine carboxypeptidase